VRGEIQSTSWIYSNRALRENLEGPGSLCVAGNHEVQANWSPKRTLAESASRFCKRFRVESLWTLGEAPGKKPFPKREMQSEYNNGNILICECIREF
jgi:hypothetical protein